MQHRLTPLWVLVIACLAAWLAAGAVVAQDKEPVSTAPAVADQAAEEQPFDHERFVRHRPGAETCLLCHGHYNPIVKRDEAPRYSLWIDSAMYYQSVHAKEGCHACHTNIDEYGHRMAGLEAMPTSCAPCHVEGGPNGNGELPLEESSEAMDEMLVQYEKMLSETGFRPVEVTTLQACCRCHEEEFNTWADSIHGQESLTNPDALTPTCIDCHGAHGILPSSDERSITHFANIPSTCLNCHDQTEIMARAGLERNIGESFKESFHGRRGEMGSMSVAICTTCHGVHDIYPSTDARSKVNKTRIAKTCGECHEGAQLNFASAFTHKTVSPTEQLGLYILKQIYKWVIFLLIAQFVVFAGLDVFQNYRHRKRKKSESSHV